jgi:hypothetical protein
MIACSSDSNPSSIETIQFENGLWYDGQGFEHASPYIVDGLLRFGDGAPESVREIDLAGGFVIPPLCEAHNHNLGGSSDAEEIAETIRAYLYNGVFYALMQGSFDLYRDQLTKDVNHAGSVDVAFANNGLTGSGGHPRRLREFLMERYGSYPEFSAETLPDAGYFEADTLAELQQKWALILAERPDLVKVMLLHSEEYEQRKDDPAYYGQRGLDPTLLPRLVRLAHDAELRVSVHVETESDLVTALQSGADLIAHVPSYDSTVRLSDSTIALAVETNAALVTTFSLAERFKERDPDLYDSILQAQRDNLARLAAAGANLVLGSDNIRDTSVGEAEHLEKLEVLDNSSILNMWTKNCASAVFPSRRIGRLADGFEASFLVLDNNPVSALNAVTSIRLRVKDGQVLDVEAPSGYAED